MKRLTPLEPFALILLFIGALNWGLIGITGGETNALVEVFGTGTLTDVVYVAIGIAALVMIPRMMATLHLSDGAHPRGV
ncbi:hypothetical protein BH24ACT23_BH24ACT23_04280 [soil metagenome]